MLLKSNALNLFLLIGQKQFETTTHIIRQNGSQMIFENIFFGVQINIRC